MTSCAPYLVLLCSALGLAGAAHIVIVPPIMFESHVYIFQTLAAALHQRGHRPVLLLSEGRALAPSPHYGLQRYPGVFNGSAADAFLQAKMRSIFSGTLTAIELFDILDHYVRNCDLVLGNRGLVRALRRQRFDLLLVDPNDMCGFALAHLLRVQYAVFSTGLWYPAEVGAPAPLAYVPEFNSLLTDRMGLLQRMKNAGVYVLSRLGVSLLVLPKYDRLLRKHGLRPATSMHELVRGPSLWMLCTDVALEFPRPSLPNVVYVGGILTRPARPLPADLESWVSNAGEHGFVLVSFGAGVKYLSEDIASKLAGALARLPQKVLWRFSGPRPKNLGNNTKLMDWLPQNDLLGHSHIKAFLSHGGLNSIFEAMYHGVPVVGVPLFGDHYDTMTRVQAKGMGILLEWKTVTEGELYEALVKVINNSSYRRRARKLSEIHRDQPGHPVRRAVYWIEYVLRHGGAPHLRAAVHRLSFCQYFLLDVAAALLLGAAALRLLLSRLAALLARTLGGWWAGRRGRAVPGRCRRNGLLNGQCERNGRVTPEKKAE